MKHYRSSFFSLIISYFIFSASLVNAQSTPEWTRNINSLPDTFPVYPVKVLNDANGNCFVLSSSQQTISVSTIIYKIILTQFDYQGNINWQLVFDNAGNGEPRGFDMTLDNSGNCYIAGGWMATLNMEPLLLKVNANGLIAWQQSSTTTFQTGYYDKLILKNDFIYLKSSNGLAKFDTTGTEIWSLPIAPQEMTVDDSGRVVTSLYTSGVKTIFRYTTNGTLDFSDSTIMAKKIVCDANGNIYLLSDLPGYTLVKFDSSGAFVWRKDNLAAPTSFGDIGLEMLIDYNGDLLLVGLQDSILKFSPTGNLIWRSSMYGLDAYIVGAKLYSTNILAVAGSVSGFAGYDMVIATYDLNGNPNWTGYYSGNVGGREFTWDLSVDGNGIYAIEDNDYSTTLAKFSNPTLDTAVDFNLICVDSVWYEPSNPIFINVRVFNGNATHVNYPSIQIVSPSGDTIGNPGNSVTYFAHVGNTYQTYTDTITDQGITDFSTYTFLMNESFGATRNPIQMCVHTGISEFQQPEFLLYPNPSSSTLHILQTSKIASNYSLRITSILGETVFINKPNSAKSLSIDISAWANGLYVVNCESASCRRWMKFIKN